MALETGNRIQDLVPTNPVGATDFVNQGDDHMRLMKVCVQGSLPNLGAGQVLASAEELSILDGATLSTAELNVLDGATLSTAELNILDGATVSAAELNILDGATLSTAELNILDGVTLTAAQINDAARKGATNAFTGSNSFSVTVSFGSNLLGADGSLATPTYSFTNDTDTGVMLRTTGVLTLVAAGANLLDLHSSRIAASTVIYGPDGSLSAPTYAFASDVDTGVMLRTTGVLTLVAAGANLLDLHSSRVAAGTVIQAVDGQQSDPSYSWTSDPSTGFWRISASLIGVAVGGANVFRFDSQANGGAKVLDYGGSLQVVGFREVPQNSQSANYTAVVGDSGKHLLHPNGGGAGDTFTIPANASVAYALGTCLTFVNRDSNALAIAITSDTLILSGTTTTGTRSLAQNGVATAIKVESTVWIISGSGLS